jgi:hypothetical protein
MACHRKEAAKKREVRRLERIRLGEAIRTRRRAPGETVSDEEQKILMEAHTAASEQERQVRLRVHPRSPEEQAAIAADRARSWAVHQAQTAPEVVAERMVEYVQDMHLLVMAFAARLALSQRKNEDGSDATAEDIPQLITRAKAAEESCRVHEATWRARLRTRLVARLGEEAAAVAFPLPPERIEKMLAA